MPNLYASQSASTQYLTYFPNNISTLCNYFQTWHGLSIYQRAGNQTQEIQMFNSLQEHNDFHYSSDSEWDSAAAWEIGQQRKDRAWILTDRDVWHANPFYTGPRVPHPESYEAECDAYNEEQSEAINDDMPF
jgi:hypothetical protein